MSGLPLANFTPDLSLKVTSQLVPASLMSQLVASEGLGVVRSVPSNFTSVSYTLWVANTALNSYRTAGSSEMRSLVSRSMTSVLAAPPADGDADADADALAPGVAAGAHAAASSAKGMTNAAQRTRLNMWPPPPPESLSLAPGQIA